MLEIPVPIQEILSKLPKDHPIRIALREGDFEKAHSFLKEERDKKGKLSEKDISFVERQIPFLELY